MRSCVRAPAALVCLTATVNVNDYWQVYQIQKGPRQAGRWVPACPHLHSSQTEDNDTSDLQRSLSVASCVSMFRIGFLGCRSGSFLSEGVLSCRETRQAGSGQNPSPRLVPLPLQHMAREQSSLSFKCVRRARCWHCGRLRSCLVSTSHHSERQFIAKKWDLGLLYHTCREWDVHSVSDHVLILERGGEAAERPVALRLLW